MLSIPSDKICGCRCELRRALAFDIHVQNGGIKPSAREEIAKALEKASITTEQELHVIIANSACRRISIPQGGRRLTETVATGTGKVHKETFVLGNCSLDESVADS
jgi:hypothetical protein